MACPACAEYLPIRQIATPDDLRAAIRRAADGLRTGVLVERACPVEAYQSNRPFLELASGGPWGDGLEYHFACATCAQEFALHAETYHGRGGAWSVVNALPWHGQPPTRAPARRWRPRGLIVFVGVASVLFLALLYHVKATA